MIETKEMSSDKFRLSCSLYELIEIWSMRGADIELKYESELGEECTHKGIITNVYSRKGLEQVELDKELIVPTKNIITINDVRFREYLK